jgi:hypothetical protein
MCRSLRRRGRKRAGRFRSLGNVGVSKDGPIYGLVMEWGLETRGREPRVVGLNGVDLPTFIMVWMAPWGKMVILPGVNTVFTMRAVFSAMVYV